MNIKEVKKIPLEDFLGRAGFSPVRRQGDSVLSVSYTHLTLPTN